MALAKKGSRIIRVEGTAYRWVVSPDDGFMRIVVEGEEVSGQRLSIQVGYDGDITPVLIRQLILKANAFGWTPLQRETELCLRLEHGELVAIR